ncbi:hypothetical protein DFR62_0765 [Planococcus citreus]|uniref:Uncharacterized protein n=1 Tax=Planococcus citreus TaxID=1373 RepID=A0A497YM95_9BACL|nr:hypothetical protein DFR62_0765 [Planococcus citreus]
MNKRKAVELVHLRRICPADVGAAAFQTDSLVNWKRLKPRAAETATSCRISCMTRILRA